VNACVWVVFADPEIETMPTVDVPRQMQNEIGDDPRWLPHVIWPPAAPGAAGENVVTTSPWCGRRATESSEVYAADR
jgi:hypothetical protein